MNGVRVVEGNMDATGHRYAVVVGRFNHFIVDPLVTGAVDTLVRHGAAPQDIVVFKVPGGVEIPLAVQRVANSGEYDAIIALGAVIRGATPHFDYVAGEASSGLGRIALEANMPIATVISATGPATLSMEWKNFRIRPAPIFAGVVVNSASIAGINVTDTKNAMMTPMPAMRPS